MTASIDLHTAALDIQISIEDGNWVTEAKLERLCTRVLGVAADCLRHDEKQLFPAVPPEVSLVFTDDKGMQSINAEWRGQDKPTNVLSFPAYPVSPGMMPGPMLGDIILAFETLQREASELNKPFDSHLSHLLVHGFLHLFGYDHMEPAQAERMEALETRILLRLDLSDPYDDLGEALPHLDSRSNSLEQ